MRGGAWVTQGSCSQFRSRSIISISPGFINIEKIVSNIRWVLVDNMIQNWHVEKEKRQNKIIEQCIHTIHDCTGVQMLNYTSKWQRGYSYCF